MTPETILGICITIAILIAVIGYIIYKIKKQGLRASVIEFIVAAERKFQEGQNTAKMDYVYNALLALIPMPFKIIITKEFLIGFIQKIFDEVKVALDYQKEDK